VDVVGGETRSPYPENLLGQYDLVFAKAKCAIEALAVGCSVVLCDRSGVGPMVTSENFDRLRRLNFGIRTLRESVHSDVLAVQIARYDPLDAAEVCRRIREVAGLDAMIEEVIAVYQDVLAEHSRAGGYDRDLEARASASYLRWLVKEFKKERYRLAFAHNNRSPEAISERFRRLVLRPLRARLLSRSRTTNSDEE
jgi:hypothetical protein